MPLECLVCHSDDICSKDVVEEVKVGSDIVYVPIHVPFAGRVVNGIMTGERCSIWKM